MNENSKPVLAFSHEANLKRRLRRYLKNLGYERSEDGSLLLPNNDKDTIRKLYHLKRREKIISNQPFIDEQVPKLIKFFARGEDICPARILPRLHLVTSRTSEARLFHLASLAWSIPVSPGYGRRMRYLVWDDYNDKLIGLIALGDPVFNQGVRDLEIGWNAKDRRLRLTNILDGYVLGAVPPYNLLLGGKLVACLVRTKIIKDNFRRKYGERKGVISKEFKRPQLVAVTTASALGRSSVYNRLKLNGLKYFESLGYTGGWGHFHIPNALFDDLRDYLREIGHPYADGHSFGDGPNWRLRTTRVALELLGFQNSLLRHGIKREMFLCRLATNADEVLHGNPKRANYDDLLSVEEVGELARDRWILRRAEHRPEYREWEYDNLKTLFRVNALQTDKRRNILAG